MVKMKFTIIAVAIMSTIVAILIVKNGITTVVRYFRTFCKN